MKELCIRCGKPTPYDTNTPITLRRYYIEGSGQLCQDCFELLYPMTGASGSKDFTVAAENNNVEESHDLCTIRHIHPYPSVVDLHHYHRRAAVNPRKR